MEAGRGSVMKVGCRGRHIQILGQKRKQKQKKNQDILIVALFEQASVRGVRNAKRHNGYVLIAG